MFGRNRSKKVELLARVFDHARHTYNLASECSPGGGQVMCYHSSNNLSSEAGEVRLYFLKAFVS